MLLESLEKKREANASTEMRSVHQYSSRIALLEKAGSIFEARPGQKGGGWPARSQPHSTRGLFLDPIPAGVAVKVLAAVSDYFGRACRSERRPERAER